MGIVFTEHDLATVILHNLGHFPSTMSARIYPVLEGILDNGHDGGRTSPSELYEEMTKLTSRIAFHPVRERSTPSSDESFSSFLATQNPATQHLRGPVTMVNTASVPTTKRIHAIGISNEASHNAQVFGKSTGTQAFVAQQWHQQSQDVRGPAATTVNGSQGPPEAEGVVDPSILQAVSAAVDATLQPPRAAGRGGFGNARGNSRGRGGNTSATQRNPNFTNWAEHVCEMCNVKGHGIGRCPVGRQALWAVIKARAAPQPQPE